MAEVFLVNLGIGCRFLRDALVSHVRASALAAIDIPVEVERHVIE